MQGPSAPKKRRLNLERMTQPMTNLDTLDTNIRLSINFNDVKVWTNLIYINLSSNMITNLPRALGDLPRLQQLNLSHNCLGLYNKIKWTWIRQTAIKNTLLFLDISYNLLTELPSQIGRLIALVELNVCHNMLKCLPQTIVDMQSIQILNLSYNRLLYLPGKSAFYFVNLQLMDLSMNPFPAQQTRSISFVEVSVLPTLVELSAKTVLHNRIPYESLIPDTLVEYLDMTKRCDVCQRTGIKLLKLYLKYNFFFQYGTILSQKPLIKQYYYCNRCREYIPECEVPIPEIW